MVLETDCQKERLETYRQQMHHIIILHLFNIPPEVDQSDIPHCKPHPLHDNMLPKHLKQHQKDHQHMQPMLPLPPHPQIPITKPIYHIHPFVQILRHRLSIPPVPIIPPVGQLRQLPQRQHYIFHYQVVKSSMDVE